MLQIRRLNLDSSWYISWAGQSFLLDPWLTGVEIDIAPFFNKQWHCTPPVSIDTLPHYDAIIVSQHFSDHCHELTLQQLDMKPIFTTPKAAKRIKKTIPTAKIQLIPEITEKNWMPLGELAIGLLPAQKKLKATFSGLVVRHQDRILVYCPHGYSFSKAQQEVLAQYQTLLLITSFSTFKLPFYLGGYVNQGTEHVKKLMKQLQPKFVIPTHDEEKHATGLVKKIATVYYPSAQQLEKDFPNTFIDLNYTDKSLEIL